MSEQDQINIWAAPMLGVMPNPQVAVSAYGCFMINTDVVASKSTQFNYAESAWGGSGGTLYKKSLQSRDGIEEIKLVVFKKDGTLAFTLNSPSWNMAGREVTEEEVIADLKSHGYLVYKQV
jgi:hypothetical protein